jgi:2-C-methyl-D-erythritol 2,4-cyclodiphosphate synthase
MLGAANLKDIGYHFPDTSSDFKNIDSKILLKECNRLIAEKGYAIVNIDSTICVQKPKLKDYIDPMKECLAGVLEIDADCVSVKATTTEKLGFVGKEEGIAAQAVVLLKKI